MFTFCTMYQRSMFYVIFYIEDKESMIKLNKTNGGITGIQPKPVVNYILQLVSLKARINYSTL